jgi:signal transduction histidine kinase/ligand-binding sensor domain-containing protein
VKSARFSSARPFSSYLRFLAAALGMVLPLTALASSNSMWFARSWQTDDGLPNNSVTGVAQTPDGFLWVATPVGLARFDGFQFEDISHTNFVPDPNRGVLTLIPSRSGGLWLAMDRGPIVRLNLTNTEVFTTNEGLPDRTAQRLAEDSKGTLWIAYRGGAVCRLLNGKVSTFGPPEGVPRGLVYSLAIDNENRVWLAEGTNLYHFANEKFEKVLDTRDPIAALARARSGGIWLCAGAQVSRYRENLEPVASFDPGPPDDAVTSILEDRTGAVWVGTSYNGLLRFDGSKFETVPTSARGIANLMEDSEGNLWVGMRAGGLDRVRMRAVQLELEESGLPFEPLQSITEASDGIFWGATQNGLLVRRETNGNWAVVPTPGSGVMCVASDRAGSVWVGTLNRQLFCWNDGQFRTWGKNEGLEGRILHSLLVSSNGDIWIGGPSTFVQRLHAGQLDTLKLKRDTGAVRAMTEDPAGNVWIGTARGALLRVAPQSEVMVDETERLGLPLMSIRALQATKDGAIWLGYAGWGLGRLKDGHFARLSTSEGLADDFVSQIVSDGNGSLWCGGDHGLFRLRQQDAEDVMAGRAARVQSIHYGAGEGLPPLQAMVGVSPGAIRSSDGRLWIPMHTALAVVDPSHLQENINPPPVLLTRVTVDNQTRGWYQGIVPELNRNGNGPIDLNSDATIRLAPGHHRVDFEFTALNFGAPESLRFRYMLEGVDDAWVDASREHKEGYSGLSEGKYRFRVSACNSSGVWNEQGAALTFTVAPFFWQTWWFRVIVGAFFICVFVGIGRYISFRRLSLKLRSLEQQAALSRERARIARDIHDDLGSRLSEITLLSELALQDHSKRESASEHIQHISVTARQATDSLDEIVWAANPRNDTLPDLIGYIGQFAQQFLQMARIGCRLQLPDQPPKWPLSAEARHNLFLVTKEALNNVVRHAQATEVFLRVSISEQSLTLVLEDNGRGFEPNREHPSADGVRNMHQRMETIGGRCEIVSTRGAGTVVTLSLPRQQDRN